jgi:diguanylate cyclase (GGDEF)-like protein
MNMPRTQAEEAGRPTIGLLGSHRRHESEALIFDGARRAAEEFGANFIYFGPPAADPDPMRELEARNRDEPILRKIDRMADHLAAFDLDGLIFIGRARECDEAHLARFRDRLASVRLLAVGKPFADAGIPSIVMPRAEEVRELVYHFHRVHGRRRIGYIPSLTPDERLDGYAEAMRELGLCDERLIVPPELLKEIRDADARVGRAIEWLLDELPEPADAVLTENRTEGTLALGHLNRRGVRVPEDVGLATCEDSYVIAYSRPALTAIDYPFHDIGYVAVSEMLGMLRGEEPPIVRAIPAVIRYRDSCGCTRDRIIPAADEPPRISARESGDPAADAAEAIAAEFPLPTSVCRELVENALLDIREGCGRRLPESLWRAFGAHGPDLLLERKRLVGRLRERLLPLCAEDPDRFRRAEAVWLAARLAADAADGAAVIRHGINLERDRAVLDSIHQELLLSQSTADVFRALNDGLGRIGIPSLWLLKEETPVPGGRRKTIFAVTDLVDIAAEVPEDADLAASYRIFRGRKPDRFSLIVEPLTANGEMIGLAWFEPGRHSPVLVRAFSQLIGQALINAGMAEETRKLVERLRQEIERRSKREAELAYYADVDALTNLFNRRFLYRALKELTERKQPFAIFCIDIDGFKGVNDTFGHHTGDELLVQIAERLKDLLGEAVIRLPHTSPDSSVREMEAIFRLGGDEFTAFVAATDECSLKRLAKRLNQGLHFPYRMGGNTAFISASIGIGVYPDDSDDPQQLLHFADMALYDAKREGNRTRLFREIREIR